MQVVSATLRTSWSTRNLTHQERQPKPQKAGFCLVLKTQVGRIGEQNPHTLETALGNPLKRLHVGDWKLFEKGQPNKFSSIIERNLCFFSWTPDEWLAWRFLLLKKFNKAGGKWYQSLSTSHGVIFFYKRHTRSSRFKALFQTHSGWVCIEWGSMQKCLVWFKLLFLLLIFSKSEWLD